MSVDQQKTAVRRLVHELFNRTEVQVADEVLAPGYVEHVDAIYKVRVGDCRSRDEAERLRLKCQAMGYKDAWIFER